MIKWEIPACIRLFRTDVFSRIVARCVNNQVIFVISTATGKTSSEIISLQPSDIIPSSYSNLPDKYSIQEPVTEFSHLQLAECIIRLAVQNNLIKPEEVETALPFISLSYKLLQFKEYPEFEKMLAELNRTLATRTTLIGYRVTIADIFVVSGIKQNPNFSSEVQHQHVNVNRWIDWIQGVLSVDYDRIMKRQGKKNAKLQKSFSKLTSSKDLIAAVKASDYARVKSFLEKRLVNIESKDYEELSCVRKSSELYDPKQKCPGDAKASTRSLEKTPMHLACERSDLEMVKLLINKGAKVDSEDKEGMTPLFYAVLSKSVEICEYLLEKGANLEHTDCQHRTPLYWVVSLDDPEMLDYFIKKGADINAPNKYGRTALSKACWYGQTKIVDSLLNCGRVRLVVLCNPSHLG